VQVDKTELDGVLRLRPKVHGDARGYFLETYNEERFAEATGTHVRFVQDNQSRSSRGVLRGLHYQIGEHAQGKLVRVLSGRIFDVAVDLRRGSETLGRWTGCYLDALSHSQFWIPSGFAHGFLVLSDVADVAYKTTSFYAPDAERSVRFDDPDVAIRWPAGITPILSDRDAAAGSLRDAELFP
jgi:dTDP-4-dehydrorhamnose 3,5-epimerase